MKRVSIRDHQGYWRTKLQGVETPKGHESFLQRRRREQMRSVLGDYAYRLYRLMDDYRTNKAIDTFRYEKTSCPEPCPDCGGALCSNFKWLTQWGDNLPRLCSYVRELDEGCWQCLECTSVFKTVVHHHPEWLPKNVSHRLRLFEARHKSIDAEVARLNALTPSNSSFVYFIKSNDFVKIGIAGNPVARLGDLQVGSPVALELLGVIPGNRSIEQSIHQMLSHYRVRGEWFQWASPVQQSVERILSNGIRAEVPIFRPPVTI
jgi:hypothetical protein